MRRLTILGCGGFIGSHLLDRLLGERSFRIEGWDLDDRKILRHLHNPALRLHLERLESPGASRRLEAAIRGSDVVVNLAAICNPAEYNKRPLDVIRGNLFDLVRTIELCSSHRKWLICFSTSEVYGRTIASYLPGNDYADPDLYELDEDRTPLILGPIANQRWTYACAKQLMERLVYAHHKEHGMPFTIVRPLNFFGPKMDYIPGLDGEGQPRVLASFMSALMQGTPMRLVDGGHARRTITSIHEAVTAILRMLDRPEAAQNQIFNIGNRNNEITIAELAQKMRVFYAEITGDPSYLQHPIEQVPAAEFYGEGYEDCDRRMPRLDKARDLLGWVPEASLDGILLETMAHYHEIYTTGAYRKKTRPQEAKRPGARRDRLMHER